MRHYNALFAVLEGNSRRYLDDMVNGHRRVPIPEVSDSPPSSKPALGFPLGTALVLFIVFGVSTLFSCCYHWEKIRSHTHRFSNRPGSPLVNNNTITNSSSSNNNNSRQESGVIEIMGSSECPPKWKCSKQALSLPVLMPGDEMPMYVAWPSPHGSLNQHTIDMASSSSDEQTEEDINKQLQQQQQQQQQQQLQQHRQEQ